MKSSRAKAHVDPWANIGLVLIGFRLRLVFPAVFGVAAFPLHLKDGMAHLGFDGFNFDLSVSPCLLYPKEIMILSLSHNFIFVHVPKTAGSSITTILMPYARDYQRSIWRSFTRRTPFKEKPENAHFRIHETAQNIARKLSRPIYDTFNSFAVVRNPFDHAVSHFEYMKQYRSKKVSEKFAKMSFEEYLAERMKKPSLLVPFFARLPDQTYFLISNSGEILVKTLIKFEDLDVEINEFAKKANLPKLSLQRLNLTTSRSDKRPYQSYFDPTTQEMVLVLYDRDFTNLGYSRKISY